MIHTLPVGSKFHVWVGTPGKISLYTASKIESGDLLRIGTRTLNVDEVKVHQSSNYYPKLNYFELNVSKTA